MIEIGMAAPHHTCIGNLSAVALRKFVAIEAGFERIAVVTDARAILGAWSQIPVRTRGR